MEITLWILIMVAVFLIIVLSYLRVLYNYTREIKVIMRPINTSCNSNFNHAIEIFKHFNQAPGPLPWPIIGNLGLLRSFDAPFQAFTELAKEFGDAYSLTLGTSRCLVVNNLDLIREVLNKNGKFFGGRPDFLRYHKLFGGNRNNSLALCDWSYLQKKRRNLARRHCSPRESTNYFTKMSTVACCEANEFMEKLHKEITPGMSFEIKPLIQQTCANMFTQYMCSVRFDYGDTDFQKIVSYFDEIFWEINQGYAVDFLPWLAPFYRYHISKIIGWSQTIRKFILERIINDREQNIDLEEYDRDFTDALLRSLVEDRNVSRETIIFMLEDFIGGHSAVGNLVMLTLAYIAKNPEIGFKIQREADAVTQNGLRLVNLFDMSAMPYVLATIFEVLRFSSSPIVPHVATEDSVISGLGVATGTIVFINNYKLNTSVQYWDNPKKFVPERFLEIHSVTEQTEITNTRRRNSEGSDSGIEFEKDNKLSYSASQGNVIENSALLGDISIENKRSKLRKNSKVLQLKKNIPHFLPFSIGKRTCIGQNLVRGFGFILVANILLKYNIRSDDVSTIQIQPACIALPAQTFPLILIPRRNS